MSVVLDGNPGERVLLYGSDGAIIRRVVVDSQGRQVIVGTGTSGAVTVAQSDANQFHAGDHGYDGSTWHKQGLIWSYADILRLRIDGTADSSGTFSLSPGAVPAGEVWRVTYVGVRNNTAGRGVAVGIITPPTIEFTRFTITTIWVAVYIICDFTLKPGDSIILNPFSGFNAGDVVQLYVCGYKMRVNM
jgi:hypothetical protein